MYKRISIYPLIRLAFQWNGRRFAIMSPSAPSQPCTLNYSAAVASSLTVSEITKRASVSPRPSALSAHTPDARRRLGAGTYDVSTAMGRDVPKKVD